MHEIIENLSSLLPFIQGYIYPNEIEIQWGLLIVLYPFLTGLVAGAFILASLARAFNVIEVKPIYRLSLLTALAVMLAAPLPLAAHLGHPERALAIFLSPKPDSAMAMFGFIYLWYLMAVLLLELWFDYRKDMVVWAKQEKGFKKYLYKFLSLGVENVSLPALILDRNIGKAITIIGIPSAFLLHGYVGFIFGAIKANPWWSTPLMPVIFIFSAMVSGIALVVLVYGITCRIYKREIDMDCLDTIGKYLFNIFAIDFALEMLDLVHRFYEAEESLGVISQLIRQSLFWSQSIFQIALGTLIPLFILGFVRIYKTSPPLRRRLYFISAALTLIGIFFMRWNVVIGGQLFSKSFLGFIPFKLNLWGIETFYAGLICLSPILFLAILCRLFPPFSRKPEVKVDDAFPATYAP